MQLFNLSQGEIVVAHLRIANTFWSRFWGLMGKKQLKPDSGLLLTSCAAIHTCFMAFPLDLVFLDSHLRIVKIVEEIPPFQFVSGGPKAYATLETAPSQKNLAVGDQLKIVAME